MNTGPAVSCFFVKVCSRCSQLRIRKDSDAQKGNGVRTDEHHTFRERGMFSPPCYKCESAQRLHRAASLTAQGREAHAFPEGLCCTATPGSWLLHQLGCSHQCGRSPPPPSTAVLLNPSPLPGRLSDTAAATLIVQSPPSP
ncbi:hypothetical protein JZ751_026764 [Albula glossodonta]|uniref:Uncharacterized protein n=1 Tax=Albula glossodonta TaxID=121402 RepID=A0A8T2PCX7_9TELE|nr:hypothetical protein JZ751_026764 [Albula glossodonta]